MIQLYPSNQSILLSHYQPPNSKPNLIHHQKNINLTSQNIISQAQKQTELPQIDNAAKLIQKTIKKKQKTKPDNKQKKRKSIKDVNGRDHKCDCGKSYLSNNALSLHIKMKHRSYKLQGIKKEQSDEEFLKQSRGKQSQTLETADPKTSIIQLQTVLNKKISKSSMTIFRHYQKIVEGFVIAESCLTFNKFLACISKIKKEKIEVMTSQMSIDQVLTIYLCNTSSVFNSTFFKIFQNAIIGFRECINLHYKTILNQTPSQQRIFVKILEIDEANKGADYSEISCAQFMPLMVEYFIASYAREHLKYLDSNLMICIFHDLCNWLYGKKLTHIKLELYNCQISKPKIKIYQQ